MNLRDRLLKLMWPMARSHSMLAIHLSNNSIEIKLLPAIFAAFGIKTIPGEDLYD